MRISDINSGSKVNQTRKKGSIKSSGNDLFSLELEASSNAQSESPQVQNISNIQSVISLDSLGILSNINNQEFVQKQNLEWGKDLLNLLENLKYQILNGKVSYNSLLNIKERLNNIPVNPSDVKLKQIIEDIEIRAAVEIEKLNKIINQ